MNQRHKYLYLSIYLENHEYNLNLKPKVCRDLTLCRLGIRLRSLHKAVASASAAGPEVSWAGGRAGREEGCRRRGQGRAATRRNAPVSVPRGLQSCCWSDLISISEEGEAQAPGHKTKAEELGTCHGTSSSRQSCAFWWWLPSTRWESRFSRIFTSYHSICTTEAPDHEHGAASLRPFGSHQIAPVARSTL